ncbi:TetR/AcrR family transcriptional regulator [Asticcacaulis sp. BYS171W]|uniref:TetR/AcrR family transcriptional regulator n=1 Tax=Asticcacaulis aquaticus TaxID=2984212 RepID=A0ABT5HR15_9CAUL|nr:TetR/AcrR family transcriptional regulator [Asticcacaulis aquaticus]MDC7682387.1 TetR/AcrR family transcriptional regulator [Asticcacaulis aquaticus]
MTTYTGDVSAVSEPVLPVKRPRGRPRSESARDTILKATMELLEQGTLREMTAEAIAKKAGVSKATLYKWWPNKTYIAFDAFMARVKMEVATPDTGSAERDFLIQVREAMAFYSSPAGRTLAQLLAEGQGDANFHEVLLERFLTQRKEEVAVMWQRGVDRGDICANIDRQMGLDILYGTMMFRFLSGRFNMMNAEEAEKLVRTAFRGFAPNMRVTDDEVWIEA